MKDRGDMKEGGDLRLLPPPLTIVIDEREAGEKIQPVSRKALAELSATLYTPSIYSSAYTLSCVNAFRETGCIF